MIDVISFLDFFLSSCGILFQSGGQLSSSIMLHLIEHILEKQIQAY